MKFSNVKKNELLTGLTLLTFLDNFDAKLAKKDDSTLITIGNGDEVRIPNPLKPRVPDFKLVVYETGDSGILKDGDTENTKDYVYLKNAGSGSITVKVLYVLT
jgi:hypothetical protein